MNVFSTLILALAGGLAAPGGLVAQVDVVPDADAPAQAPAAPAAEVPLDEQLAALDAELALPYGDLVLSEEEARLDLRAAPRLVWALIGEELADARLDALVVEAPVDRWQLLDELWLRVESLPYLGPGWTRVRVRAGSFESQADRLRAEDLLSALALRLLDLEALKQAPAAPLAPAAPAASAGGGAFAGAPTTTYVPLWIPIFAVGSVACAAPLVFADTYAWAYGGYGNYWPSYASACDSFGFSYGYGYGGLGHSNHYYGGSYALGFHHGFHQGFAHGLYWDPWYDLDAYHHDIDIVVIVDADDDAWDGWENGGDAGEDGLTPDEAGRGSLAMLRERKQNAAASDDGVPARGDDRGDDRGDAGRDDRVGGVVPVVRREVERRNPTRVSSVMPESAVPSREPMIVRRTSERTGRPPALRSSAVVDRVVRRSAPEPAAPLVVGRPSLLPPTYGGGARTISASGVTRAGVPVASAAPSRVSSATRAIVPSNVTSLASTSSRAADIVSRATSSARPSAPAYVPTPAPSSSPRTTSPRTSASRLFDSGSRASSPRASSPRSTSSRSSSSGSSSTSSRASSSSRGSSSTSSGRGRGGDR